MRPSSTAIALKRWACGSEEVDGTHRRLARRRVEFVDKATGRRVVLAAVDA
jgi:hypothetical protein